MTKEEKKQELEKIFGYDNEEGIKKYLEKGLEGLHALIAERHKAGYERKEHLQQFVILGHFWLDSCGNVLQLEGPNLGLLLGDVLSMERLRSVFPDFELRGVGRGPLPKMGDKCVFCGHGWVLGTLHDSIVDAAYEGETPKFSYRHEVCARVDLGRHTRAEFSEVFDAAGFTGLYELSAIPNEYCRCVRCGPWFVAETPYGQIKIGWRKRVINLDWSGTQNTFPTLFAEEDVTQGTTYIHAWGYEKATDYLGRLLRELKKRKDEAGSPVPA